VLRRAFSKYLSPDVIEKLVDDPASLARPSPAERGTITFLIANVRDDTLGNVPQYLDRCLTIIEQCDGFVSEFFCSTVIAAFDVPMRKQADHAARLCRSAVDQLLVDLGHDVRIIYGRSPGLIGNLGTSKRLHYGFALPNASASLVQLLTIEYGSAVEATRPG
jgi:hypothetical protein